MHNERSDATQTPEKPARDVRRRRLTIAVALCAIALVLALVEDVLTGLGFLAGLIVDAITGPVLPVLGAVMGGPIVGLVVGAFSGVLFGLLGSGLGVSLLPRLLVGPAAWLVWDRLKQHRVIALLAAGIAGTFVYRFMIRLLWGRLFTLVFIYDLKQLAAAVVIILVVGLVWLYAEARQRMS
jgi:uncharacterized membrane protein